MPERNITKRIDSKEIQGEGSYVVLRRLTIGYVKAMRRNEKGESNLELNEQAVLDHLVEWNWVDSDGKPLPIPKDAPEILDAMTFEETDFLIGSLFGSDEVRKN